MIKRFVQAGLLLAFVSGCAGGSGTSVVSANAANSTADSTRSSPETLAAAAAAAANIVANPGFETGSLSSWSSCGSANTVSVSTARAHSGSYSALLGTTAKPEVNGTAGICQTVTVPTSGSLTFWVYEGTNDSATYVSQGAQIRSTSGSKLTQLYTDATSTNGWVEKSFSLTSYAGQTVQLYFYVSGNGYASDYVYMYLDDVSLTGSGTASSAPTTAPTGAPTTAPFACNNSQFNTYQSEFANGSISADQFVDVCGSVTKVLAEADTSSGHHGYFYVELPSGYQIEIVSNLDAMAEASSDRPPSTWPWVAVNDYVYVQGRYYYDSSSSQGIDWTEDDTSSSWEHVGYVAVCTSSGTNCQKYW